MIVIIDLDGTARPVDLPKGVIGIPARAVHSMIGCSNMERHPGLWNGFVGSVYTDAKAVAQNKPVNPLASKIRRAAIRNDADAANLLGVAVFISGAVVI